jgi:GPH family glycoside/pentoside/hexuronide:cation symporter
VLLVFTAFDERQNVSVEALRGEIAVIKEQAEKWQKEDTKTEDRLGTLRNQLSQAIDQSNKLQQHFAKRARDYPDQSEHFQQLIQSTAYLRSQIRNELRASSDNLAADPDQVIRLANNFLQQTTYLKQQAPKTLFRLRLVEIGVPLALSIVSILLTLRYPLTEARSYEIKAALQQRHAETAADKS